MTPPINLPDGTEVSEVILPDGATASEVVAPDGSTVFGAIPESGVGHFDASSLSLSDGQTVNTFTDLSTRENDLSAVGGPTFETNRINGLPVVQEDGIDDSHVGSEFGSAQSQPTVLYAVFDLVTASPTGVIVDGVNSFYQFTVNSNGNWAFFAGEGIESNTATSGIHSAKVRADGTNSFIEIDGTQVASGDAGTDSRDGFTLGANINGGFHGEVGIGEVIEYADPSPQVQSDVENALATKWGVSF